MSTGHLEEWPVQVAEDIYKHQGVFMKHGKERHVVKVGVDCVELGLVIQQASRGVQASHSGGCDQ